MYGQTSQRASGFATLHSFPTKGDAQRHLLCSTWEEQNGFGSFTGGESSPDLEALRSEHRGEASHPSLLPSCSSPCPHPNPPSPGCPSLVPQAWALHRCPQHGICPRQDLILVGIQSEKFDLESINRVDHGHQGDSGESPGGKLKAAGAGQLNGQCLEEELGQVLAQTGPYASSEGEVVEPAVLVFTSTLTKAVRVEDIHVLEDGGSVVGVPDAVHHAPAFGDLETLQRKRKGWRENQNQLYCKERGSRMTR